MRRQPAAAAKSGTKQNSEFQGNSHKRTADSLRNSRFGERSLGGMGYYSDGPPPHSHRSPAELAEAETLAAWRGDYCGPLTRVDDQESRLTQPCAIPRRLALVRWADIPRIGRRQ